MKDDIDLLAFEKELYKLGHTFIAGVDEVGRGPLAGPVVAAAVILPVDADLPGVYDSKQLSAKKRREMYEIIKGAAVGISIGVATVVEIDEINILQATKLAMCRAIAGLNNVPSYLLIDHLTLDLDIPQQGIVKGDALSLSIAAASIVAKEYRDKLMKELGEMYPEYAFEKNSGYGTKIHREAITNHGYIKGVHRLSFEPVKSIVASEMQIKLF